MPKTMEETRSIARIQLSNGFAEPVVIANLVRSGATQSMAASAVSAEVAAGVRKGTPIKAVKPRDSGERAAAMSGSLIAILGGLLMIGAGVGISYLSGRRIFVGLILAGIISMFRGAFGGDGD